MKLTLRTFTGFAIFQVGIICTLKVEPLYADSDEIAELLMSHGCPLLPQTHDVGVVLYSWNAKAQKLMDKMGIPIVDPGDPAMFTQHDLNHVNSSKIYALSSTSFFPF